MTLNQVKAMRDKYYDALLTLDTRETTHSIGDASYSLDEHRESLQRLFEYYDKLYNLKSSAGRNFRLGKKAV